MSNTIRNIIRVHSGIPGDLWCQRRDSLLRAIRPGTLLAQREDRNQRKSEDHGEPTVSRLARLPVDKPEPLDGSLAVESVLCRLRVVQRTNLGTHTSLWAINQLLQIIDRKAADFTLEPLDIDESQGIEFSVTTYAGMVEYWRGHDVLRRDIQISKSLC